MKRWTMITDCPIYLFIVWFENVLYKKESHEHKHRYLIDFSFRVFAIYGLHVLEGAYSNIDIDESRKALIVLWFYAR